MQSGPAHYVLAAAVLLAAAATPAEDVLGPGTYVYIDTSVREITLEGMEKRLAALRAGADAVELRALSVSTRDEIETIYADWGFDPASHARFGMRHAEAIDQWLANNPAWARSYEDLARRHERLSRAIDQATR